MAVIAPPRTLEKLQERDRPLRPDFLLIIPLLALTALGVLMVYSASAPLLEAQGLSPYNDVQRHLVAVGLGIVVFTVASLIKERTLRSLAPFIYIGAVLLLIAVLSPFGEEIKGAQRWIQVGGFQLQPSEIAKPALIIALASLLAGAEEGAMRWSRVLRALVVVGVPSVLIFLQPDLGTMIVFGFLGLTLLFVAGTTFRQLLLLVAAGLIGLFVVLSAGVLEDYQVSRLTAFFDSTSDLAGANFNQFQSQVAIGSGQLFGKGLFEGAQTNLSYVPSQSTDFIFTAVGEQLGFMGAALVIFAYALILWRLLMAAAVARDRFSQLVAAGAASLIGVHAFINIGMTVGIMPVTGLPLPFMSFGGTAFLFMSGAVGLAHAVYMRRSPVPGERRLLDR